MLLIMTLIIMMPLASFAKVVAITDQDLDAVTAEQGVSINFTALTVGGTTALSSISWGDTDGFTGYLTAGYAGTNAITITGSLAKLDGTMVIDVGTSGTGSSATRINIQLPTVTLGAMNVAATLKLASSDSFPTGAGELGAINMVGFSTQVTGSCQVFAH
jgi:hypothetical protein